MLNKTAQVIMKIQTIIDNNLKRNPKHRYHIITEKDLPEWDLDIMEGIQQQFLKKGYIPDRFLRWLSLEYDPKRAKEIRKNGIM